MYEDQRNRGHSPGEIHVHDLTNRVTTSFTSVGNEADRVVVASVRPLLSRLTDPADPPTLAPETSRPTHTDLAHAVQQENTDEASRPMDDWDRAVHHRGTHDRRTRICRVRRRPPNVHQGDAERAVSGGHLTKRTLTYANENCTVPNKRLQPEAVEVCPVKVRFNWTSGRGKKHVSIGPYSVFSDGLSANS
jgi:hypothetical protein